MNVPRFELRRVDEDGSSSAPTVYDVASLPIDATMGRRGFLGAGIMGAALLAVGGCSSTKGASRSSLPAAFKDAVTGLRFLSGGSLLLAGSRSGEVRSWSVAELKIKSYVYSGQHPALAMDAGRDDLALVGFEGGELYWWRPEKSAGSVNLGRNVLSVAVSPIGSGSYVGTASGEGKTPNAPHGIVVYGAPATLRAAWDVDGDVRAVTASPDGTMIAAAQGGHDVVLLSSADGSVLTTLRGHTGRVNALAFGTVIASASDDDTIRLWSVPSGEQLAVLTGHAGDVNCLAIARDGTLLASGSDDETVALWTLPDGRRLVSLEGHRANVLSVAIDPAAATIASGDADGVIVLWSVAQQRLVSYLFDPAINAPSVRGVTYSGRNEFGQVITYTLPCGSPIPAGATCVCNCVPGTFAPPRPAASYGTRTYCRCVPVCTCVPICQAHKLLDFDPIVRRLARQVLLAMGLREIEYLRWASAGATPRLREALAGVIEAMRRGAGPEQDGWPSPTHCGRLLDAADPVVRILAAQGIALQGVAVDARTRARVVDRLRESERRRWNAGASDNVGHFA